MEMRDKLNLMAVELEALVVIMRDAGLCTRQLIEALHAIHVALLELP